MKKSTPTGVYPVAPTGSLTTLVTSSVLYTLSQKAMDINLIEKIVNNGNGQHEELFIAKGSYSP
jgi:hypothetical protein